MTLALFALSCTNKSKNIDDSQTMSCTDSKQTAISPQELTADSVAFIHRWEPTLKAIHDSLQEGEILYHALALKEDAEPYLGVKMGRCEADYLFRIYEMRNDTSLCVFETGAGHCFFYKQGCSIFINTCQSGYSIDSRIMLCNGVFHERKLSEYYENINDAGEVETEYFFQAEKDKDEEKYSNAEAVYIEWIRYKT